MDYTIKFEVTKKRGIIDVEEFCRIVDELTYVGHFANIKTSKIIPGAIIQFNGKFYTTEVCTSNATGDMIKTSVSLLKPDCYIPEECKSLKDCSIFIDVWDSYNRPPCLWEDSGGVNPNEANLICSYAFFNDQLEEAKKVVYRNKYVDIFIDAVQIAKTTFLES